MRQDPIFPVRCFYFSWQPKYATTQCNFCPGTPLFGAYGCRKQSELELLK